MFVVFACPIGGGGSTTCVALTTSRSSALHLALLFSFAHYLQLSLSPSPSLLYNHASPKSCAYSCTSLRLLYPRCSLRATISRA